VKTVKCPDCDKWVYTHYCECGWNRNQKNNYNKPKPQYEPEYKPQDENWNTNNLNQIKGLSLLSHDSVIFKSAPMSMQIKAKKLMDEDCKPNEYNLRLKMSEIINLKGDQCV